MATANHKLAIKEAVAKKAAKLAINKQATQFATTPVVTENKVIDSPVGVKYDSDKPDMSLLSSHAMFGLSKVLSFGAAKYASHNWRKGIARSRLLAAALRHIFAYLAGQNNDPESGLSHLSHAMCCLMFASELHVTMPSTDDRHVVKPE